MTIPAGAWLDWLTLPIAIEIAALAAIAVFGLCHFAKHARSIPR